MKKSQEIDYFAEPSSKEEAAIRRIKGNFRREFVMRAVLGEGIESVPPAWLEHDISSFLKDFLTSRHPRARGGEDLPDLEDGQVEIARLSLTDSVHGEVPLGLGHQGRGCSPWGLWMDRSAAPQCRCGN